MRNLHVLCVRDWFNSHSFVLPIILKFTCGKELLAEEQLIAHLASLCCSTTPAVLTWDFWLYPTQESQWFRVQPQWYTPYTIHWGFLLSNLCHFCSNGRNVHAGSDRTCGHWAMQWETPCSRKLSHTPGRRGCTRRCRDEISQALIPQRQHLAVVFPKGWWQTRIALKCSVLNKQCQCRGRDLSFTPLADFGAGIFKLFFLNAFIALVLCLP